MAERVEFSPSSKEQLRLYLSQEITNAISDRGQLERKWSDHIIDYVARRPEGSADFPWPGAPQEIMPLIGMHADPVYSDLMQSVHAPSNLWTALALGPDWVDLANPVTEYLKLIERRFLKMRKVDERAFLDLVVLGTTIYRHGWKFEQRSVKDYDENQNVVTLTQTSDRPIAEHIHLQDFLMPANAWDTDADAPVAPARWCGHRFKLTKSQLASRAKGQEPYLPNYDPEPTGRVLTHEEQTQTPVEKTIREAEKVTPYRDYKIELFEIWARWDVDDDGVDEDIRVVYSHRANEILQATYNPFLHGKRPYEAAKYMPGFGFYGVGIAQLDEWAQATSSLLLNATLANVLIANTRMFGVPQGTAISSNEPIYPGKIWPLGPGEAISEVKLGEVYPSLFQLHGAIHQWAEHRTGVNELRTGNITGLPSRTPATTILSLLREGNKRFDMIHSNLRTGALANVGLRTFQNVSQRAKVDSKWGRLAVNSLGERDGGLVEQALRLPLADIEEGLGIEVTATSGLVNREIEKQNLLGLGQIMAQAYTQLIQVAQMLDPMGQMGLVQQVAGSALTGGIELARRILEAYETQNPDTYLPDINLAAMQGEATAAGNGLQGMGLDPNMLAQLFAQGR